MKKIKAIIKGISGLKPFPQTLREIMMLTQDPNPDMHELADIIAKDPVLTANLLKDANSAYYGCSGKFETVHQIVVFLGTLEVLRLALLTGCQDTLTKTLCGYGLQAGELWRFSLCSAMLARAVAVKAKLINVHFIFTVGLIKDIGKIALSQFVSEEFEKIRSLVETSGYSFCEAEKAMLGIDHAQLGGLLAQVWRFSPKMADMIRHHHRPFQCGIAVYEAGAVYMGDILCMMLGIGVGADGLAYRFKQQVTELLGLSDRDIQMLLIEFEEQMANLTNLLDCGNPVLSDIA